MGLLGKIFGGGGPNYEVTDVYRDLRDRALGLAQDDQGIGAGKEILAVVMDTDLGNAAYTLMAGVDGALSLYFSNGGGVIGTGERAGVGTMATTFVEEAFGYREHLQEVAAAAHPSAGCVRMTFVLRGRILSAEFREDDLGNDRSPLSPLFHGAHQLIAIVRQFDEMKAEPPLIFSIWEGKEEDVGKLIAGGAEIGTESSEGIPAIGMAVRCGEAGIVKMLLAAGADANTRVDSAEASLHDAPVISIAAAQGKVEVLDVLVQGGAGVDDPEATGLTALHMASFMGENGAVAFLLDRGASLEARDESGYTPLMMAANAGKAACVATLLARGANVLAIDDNRCTPLMFCAQHGYADVVRLLLAKGADPNFVGGMGLSALAFAEQNGHSEVLNLMRGLA